MSEKMNSVDESTNMPGKPEVVVDEIIALSRRPIIELYDQIGRGDYKVVFGDDASARLQALIWREFLGLVGDGQNPETLFLAGSKDLTAAQMNEKAKQITAYLNKRHIKELFSNKDDKAIIITDTIQTGQSLLPLTYALANLGINYDVVTNVLIDETPQAIVESNLGAKIHYGNKHREPIAPYSYRNVFVSGVTKNPEDLFSSPQDLGSLAPGQTTSDILTQSRKLIEPAAQKMFEYYHELE